MNRLSGVRREAVVQALRHSASTGRPASEEAVELLVAYAEGEITAQQYASGILRSFGMSGTVPHRHDVPARQPSAYVAEDVDAAPALEHAAQPGEPGTIRREDAVHAYVTGQIPVGEFLRIARG